MEAITWLGKLASAHEGALLLGVSRQRFVQLAAKPGFPAPYDTIAVGRIWLAETLEAYASTRDRRSGARIVRGDEP